MGKILLAWELGENWGHLARDLPVLRRLCARGHQVVCAVCDTRIAEEVLGPAGIPFVQAPMAPPIARMSQPLASYAELLLAKGYSEPPVLRGLIAGWRGLMDIFHADVAIVDYAPSALLAARIQGIPVVLIGAGFELPPQSSPLPSLRPWERIAQDRLLLSESVAVGNINDVLVSCQTQPLARFADVFQAPHRILLTFPELDHYGERCEENYVGPLYEMLGAPQIEWPNGGCGLRIFAYLRPWVPGVTALLLALQKTGCSVVCVLPGPPSVWLQQFQTPLLRVVSTVVSLEPLLPTADLVIGYGSGLIAAALLAGVPLLLVPRWSEQYLSAQRVEALGAGLMMRGEPNQTSYSSIISTLLGTPGFRQGARAFAKKHESFSREQSVQDAADGIETVFSH